MAGRPPCDRHGKMAEISTAMSITGLGSPDEFVAARDRNRAQQESELDGMSDTEFVTCDEAEKNDQQHVVSKIDEATAGLGRDRLRRLLWAENVLARCCFYLGCHRMAPYRSCFPHAGLLRPETEKLAKRVPLFPAGTSVHREDVSRICSVIRPVATNGEELRAGIRQANGRKG